MKVVGKFERVSLEEFSRSIKLRFDTQFSDEIIQEMYEKIKLPRRATSGSAGYDFFSPFYFFLPSWGDIIVPTGIKVRISDGWFLGFYPRSGTGMKNYLRIANTVGIVDADYYGNASNEGHIMVKVRKESGPLDTSEPTRDVEFRAGDAFCQAVFQQFGVVEGDEADGDRTGGFGSTDAD